MSWAMQMPKSTLGDASARHVLLCLANYAGQDGRGAFPSAEQLAEDTGLSERTVRYKLDLLEEMGLITRGNQAIAAAYIGRKDRITNVYDLQLKRGAVAAPGEGTGCSSQQHGVQSTTERGAAVAPNTSGNQEQNQEQGREGAASASGEAGSNDPETAPDQPQSRAKGFSLANMQAMTDTAGIAIAADVAQDYLAHRRGIKAPLNATIWKTTLIELAKLDPHGITADQALAEAMAAGWRGLKSEWLVNRLKRQQGPGAGPNDDDTSWANNLNEDL
ncbi:helix-turn-helix domain-containing protein [uncultured Pseudomonas sp.]|uniref:helix-turn-helix domain-containing protein n=1 Tax=uncultured Pseudomonas sp. TaxID=114707 RepID=UPI0025850FF2|nr:helix-turn-helix domain-containing protein [uncultured Pseudomonas sp.]